MANEKKIKIPLGPEGRGIFKLTTGNEGQGRASGYSTQLKEIKGVLDKFYTGEKAKTYNKSRLNDIRQVNVLDRESSIIKSFLKNSMRGNILDVACGTGIMFKNYGNRNIYGIDISKDMLKVAKKDYPSAKLKISEAEKLPFNSNFFSAAITSRFICHTPNYKKIIMEMTRVVKPGGSIIIDFFNRNSLSLPTTKLRLIKGRLRYFNLFTYKDIIKIAQENNLKIRYLKSKVFFPPSIFPKFMHSFANSINLFFAELFPKLSNPMYIMFIKNK